MSYVIGYAGKVVDEAGFLSSSQYLGLEPEMGRRIKALADESNHAGHPVSIGGSLRSSATQDAGFHAVHREVSVSAPHCCITRDADGHEHFWQQLPGTAHKAPMNRSWHEASDVTRTKACAADMIGDMAWLDANVARFGLRWVSPERWHVQPLEIPVARPESYFLTAPLPAIALPKDAPVGAPVRNPAVAPAGTPMLVAPAGGDGRTRALQLHCNFWGWRDDAGNLLFVDDVYGAKTAQAIKHMQTALHIYADGKYGNQSQLALQLFFNNMAALAG